MDTRSATEQLAFGHPTELSINVLPTELDVARSFLYEQKQWKVKNLTEKDPDKSVIADLVVENVQRIYARASIPTVRKDVIKSRLLAVYDRRLSLQKIPAVKRYNNPSKPSPKDLTPFFIKKKECFLKSISGLFEVADKVKIPVNEQEFLDDQRTRRVMTISDKIDGEASRRQERRIKDINMQAEQRRIESERKRTLQDSAPIEQDTSDKSDSEVETVDSGALFVPGPSTSKSFSGASCKKSKDLGQIAEAKVRNDVSDRATAAIVNATLRAYNIPEVIDKSKLRRAVENKFKEIENSDTTFGGGLCYDGRKDQTLIQKTLNSKYYQSRTTEEHITLVSMPDGGFLGHVIPADGKAVSESASIIDFLEQKGILMSLETLSCDGTNTNVGAEGGINHFIEAHIGRPLQWFICLLHANELPLRHLIISLDGPTTGSNTFSGPIGQMLPNVTYLPIVKYKRFSRCDPLEAIPEHVWKDLSTDQKYMWRITTTLITGDFDEYLALLTIGPCCHSRWLTTACRIGRLYACTMNPSETLTTITSYIVNVYAPMWFRVKHHERAIDGPRHLFFLINKSTKIANSQSRQIVQRCIQRNAFFAHPENILLAQLASSVKTDRVDAVRTIVEMRSHSPQSTVRLFRVPELDFKAKAWHLMINWNTTEVFEPPLIRKLSTEELQTIVTTPLEVPHYKCHTQMVERAVKEVTKASSSVVGTKKRDAKIKTTLESRKKYPKQETKKNFQT